MEQSYNQQNIQKRMTKYFVMRMRQSGNQQNIRRRMIGYLVPLENRTMLQLTKYSEQNNWIFCGVRE